MHYCVNTVENLYICNVVTVYCFFFFFSSRRRHTRCALVTGVQTCALPICLSGGLQRGPRSMLRSVRTRRGIARFPAKDWLTCTNFKIGRASCRERVCQYV